MSGGITIHDLKLYYRAIVIKKKKPTWYWYRDKRVYQWSRIELPEISTHTYDHLIFEKGSKNHPLGGWGGGEDRTFNK